MILNIVLDLDETLIHSSTRKPKTYDFIIDLKDDRPYYVKKRPKLEKFLSYIFKKYKTVSVWTAATHDYAIKVIENIFTAEQRKMLKFFHTRRHTRGGTKPLEIIFNSDEAKNLGIQSNNTIIIDDKPDVVYHNPGNGIIIPAWSGSPRDTYLMKLIIVLNGILKYKCLTDSSEFYLELTEITN